ncbi:hybrid sensor histidine kinase/response regulator [Calothrix sp. NIES-2098]|uniref:hybrid sensor histidine kinase/response regulator n=1 Tax=Calothrix sp. NIES-2098 TaxID=1954171 RepID=UPI000B5F79AF|nr:PAS/PAC sensor hybrid histidine kinase [Calothrix sp. NIES-2098]
MKFLMCTPEAARLEVLRQYHILDTGPEQAFDDLAFLAAQICETPIALINLIDANRQWFKAKVGLDMEQMPIEIGFCPLCIQKSQSLIIPDTLADERFANSEVVTCEPHIRFYAGVPLIAPGGEAIGTICVVDRVPHQISQKQVESLQALSRLVVKQLEIRRNLAELANLKTECQQAQQAQHQSESTLRSFFDSAPMMMGIVELVDNDILHISDNLATAKFFGLTPSAMENRLEREMGVPHKHLVQWLHYYHQAEQSQSPVRFEYSYDTLQGQTWLSATVSAIAQSTDRRPQFAYVIDDISNRKQAEEELRWKEALLRSMASVSPLAFYVVDNRTDAILYFNDRFCEIWGIEHLKEPMADGELKNQDIIPDCIKSIVDVPAFAASCQPLQSEEYRCVIEDEIAFNDGRTIRRFSTQVRDCQDRYFGRLYIFEDITHKKQLEQQFLRAQRMESIGRLASGIAHDLNNVLSPILMSVQILKNKLHDQQIEQMLSIIENNTKRGSDLVKQVLSFARGIEGDRRVIQIKHLIFELQQIIQETFPKTIIFSTELEPDLLPVYADSTQLHQVLVNLCLNARDAMPNGGKIAIAAKNIYIDEIYSQSYLEAQVGHYIVLTVSDTGLGIPQEILDKIFEPFFTTKEFGSGTGLGLSTVMGIIQGHNGFINVSSCVGKNTDFKVYLPAVNTVASQMSEDQEMPSGNGELLLVVDDEAAIREITTTSLESYNYQTISASDGIEAIAIYAQNQDKIKVAIIDMMMPKMDGATTIHNLQNMNPKLPIIAVSGLATSEQVFRDKTSQHTAFLSKPYTVQELLKTLQVVLSHQ